jgi:hypothetical protein
MRSSNHNVEELCARARLFILLGPISGLRTGNFTIKLVVSFSLWMLCAARFHCKERQNCMKHTQQLLCAGVKEHKTKDRAHHVTTLRSAMVECLKRTSRIVASDHRPTIRWPKKQ